MNWNENANQATENLKQQQPMPAQCGQEIRGLSGAAAAHRPSLFEEADKQAAHHYEQAAKAARAAEFFRAHPEFGVFIQLIREGAIGI